MFLLRRGHPLSFPRSKEMNLTPTDPAPVIISYDSMPDRCRFYADGKAMISRRTFHTASRSRKKKENNPRPAGTSIHDCPLFRDNVEKPDDPSR